MAKKYGKYPPNPLVEAVVDDNGVPPVSILRLTGYLGPVVAGRRRIYDDDFDDASEFPANAIRFHRPGTAPSTPHRRGRGLEKPRDVVSTWSRGPRIAQGGGRSGPGGGGPDAQGTYRPGG